MSASRRTRRVRTPRAPESSYMRAPTYSAAASNAKRTSVRCVEPTVQMNLLVQRHRLDFRGRRGMDVLRCQGRGTQHGEKDGESRHGGRGARIQLGRPAAAK